MTFECWIQMGSTDIEADSKEQAIKKYLTLVRENIETSDIRADQLDEPI